MASIYRFQGFGSTVTQPWWGAGGIHLLLNTVSPGALGYEGYHGDHLNVYLNTWYGYRIPQEWGRIFWASLHRKFPSAQRKVYSKERRRAELLATTNIHCSWELSLLSLSLSLSFSLLSLSCSLTHITQPLSQYLSPIASLESIST
jgi:hypothetical protein